jgi:tetratricopeptide (TPR) repeat protein
LAALGNYTGAIEYYDKALTIQPNDSYALDNKGLALDNLGNHTGAIEYYDKALTINPKYEAALDNKAAALDDLGNHTGAIEYYDKALTINPKYEAALDNNTFLHEVNKSFSGNNIYLHAKVAVNGFEVRSDIALTGQQQAKGLDIKNNLTENQGMLFVF